MILPPPKTRIVFLFALGSLVRCRFADLPSCLALISLRVCTFVCTRLRMGADIRGRPWYGRGRIKRPLANFPLRLLEAYHAWQWSTTYIYTYAYKR